VTAATMAASDPRLARAWRRAVAGSRPRATPADSASAQWSFNSSVDSAADAIPLARQSIVAAVSLGGQAVVNTRPAIDGLTPRFHGSTLFQTMEHRIDDTFTEGNGFAGHELYGAYDFVAVHLLAAEKAQYQKLRNAAHEWGISLCHRS
jgi:hypothetical protein